MVRAAAGTRAQQQGAKELARTRDHRFFYWFKIAFCCLCRQHTLAFFSLPLAGKNKMKDWDVGGAEEQEGEAAVGGQIEAQSDSDEGGF